MPLLRRGHTRGVGLTFDTKDRLPVPNELALIALYFGFAAAVSQVTLIRELLAVFRGNEFIIGVMFSAWFLGIYLGARLSRESDADSMIRRVRAAALMLPPVLVLSAYGPHVMSAVVPRSAGTFYTFTAELSFSLFFTIPTSFIIGWFFPPVVALVSGEEGEASGGRVYYIESAGSFLGGLAFSFVFAGLLNPLQIIIILSVFSLAICLWRMKIALAALCIALAVLFFHATEAEFSLFSRLWQANRPGRLEAYERTRYQAVALCADRDSVGVYGDGVLLYTLPDAYEARQVFHLIMALKEIRGGRILVFGSAPGSVPYNLLRAGAGEVCYCEPDAGLWRIVKPRVRKLYGVGDGRAGLKIIRRDVREYLLNSREGFDLIVNLSHTPENIMHNRLFTGEFYGLCRSRLKPGGVMIASVMGFSNYLGADLREFILSIYGAFTGVFPRTMITSGEVMYLVGARDPGALPGNPAALIEGYGKRLPAVRGASIEKEIMSEFDPAELSMLFEKSHLDYFREVAARSMPKSRVNGDMNPRAYWSHIMLSSLQEKSVFYRLLRGGVFVPLVIVLALAAAMADIAVRRVRRGASGGFLVYIAGFTGISTVTVMIILLQIFEGTVYHRVALINACFMLGLAAGAYAFTGRKTHPAALFVFMAASLGLIYAYMNTGSGFFFWPVLLLFSFLSGGVFPALFARMTGIGFHERAGILDSMDHFGAISGSAATVLILVPAAGIGGTVAFCMAMMAIAALACVFTGR